MVTHHGMTDEKCPKERVMRVEYNSATGIEQTEDSEIPVTLNAITRDFTCVPISNHSMMRYVCLFLDSMGLIPSLLPLPLSLPLFLPPSLPPPDLLPLSPPFLSPPSLLPPSPTFLPPPSLLEVYWGWTDAASAGNQEEVY